MFARTVIGALALGLSLNLIDFETGSYNNMAENPIILDMDFCTDVDDAVAVRMATTLDDMDVCTLMAVGLCTTPSDGSDINLKAVNGLLTYDGYSEVPIGKAHVEEPETSPYWSVCAEYSKSSLEAKDAVELYKEVLDSCYNKVTIVTTGYLTNVQYLLEDTEGYNLVRDHCERIVVTGGTYPTGRDNNFSFNANAAQAAKYVEENCPVQIVYVPNDVGGTFTAGGLIQQLSSDDVLSRSLSAFGTQEGRFAWDPTAVFIAAVPRGVSNFDYIPVDVEFNVDGSHTFTEITGEAQGIIHKATDAVTATSNEIRTVTPTDMFEMKPQSQSETREDKEYPTSTEIVSTISENTISETSDTVEVKDVSNSSRLAVRHKDGVSSKQYQDMIEGIISYKYLR